MTLNHRNYYRLPWNYADNVISWLEPTTKCNLRCKGCYRKDRDQHKTIEEIKNDLETFRRLRNSDCISITGGEPLIHPQIIDIVRMVKSMGWKPIINSNGVKLDEKLLRELKKAGVFGFTFHIDTSQKRPGINAKTETELNDLRLHYAKMLNRVGGISCSFNATITEKTIHEIPNMIKWAEQHAHIVHTMVFILFRSPILSGDFDHYANGELIDLGKLYDDPDWGGKKGILAQNVVSRIREVDPKYEPCAYLNGTANPDSFKWLLANRLVQGGNTIDYVSPKFMELVQTGNHLFTGKYLSYASPRSSSMGKIASLFTSLFDKKMRKIFGKLMLRNLNPINIFRPAQIQSIMIIQPININPDGRQDMCDACPDITVHKDKLVWSCRLEELNEFGCFISSVPKGIRCPKGQQENLQKRNEVPAETEMIC